MTRHTLPDYTGKYKQQTVYGNVDNGELAVRLGASSRFDRRGQTIWLDDFEAAILRWESTLASPNTTCALSNVRALAGEQSMKLVTGDEANNWCRITRNLAYPVLSKIGFEISNTYAGYIDRIAWEIKLWTGTRLYIAEVEWENSTNSLFYKSATDDANQFPVGTTTEFATDVDFFSTTGGFNTCKLVVDFTTGRYVRFIHNDVTYDMSDLFYLDEAEAITPPNMHVRVCLDGGDVGGATIATVYYDNAIVTQNEDI